MQVITHRPSTYVRQKKYPLWLDFHRKNTPYASILGHFILNLQLFLSCLLVCSLILCGLLPCVIHQQAPPVLYFVSKLVVSWFIVGPYDANKYILSLCGLHLDIYYAHHPQMAVAALPTHCLCVAVVLRIIHYFMHKPSIFGIFLSVLQAHKVYSQLNLYFGGSFCANSMRFHWSPTYSSSCCITNMMRTNHLFCSVLDIFPTYQCVIPLIMHIIGSLCTINTYLQVKSLYKAFSPKMHLLGTLFAHLAVFMCKLCD